MHRQNALQVNCRFSGASCSFVYYRKVSNLAHNLGCDFGCGRIAQLNILKKSLNFCGYYGHFVFKKTLQFSGFW